MKTAFLPLGILAATLPGAALAQYDPSAFQPGDPLDMAWERDGAAAGFAPDTGGASAPILTFAPDRAQRARTYAEFVDRIGRTAPEDAASLEGTDLFAAMAGAMAPYGLSTDSLPDATAVYMIELWDAANGQATDLSREAVRTLSGQIRDAYAAARDPGLFDAAKVQEQADTYLLQGWLITSMRTTFEAGGGGAGDAEAFRASMRALGREVFGIDLTRATINERGLIPGEAVGALGDAVREGRAERAAADPEGEAERAMDAAFGTPCGVEPSDATERKLLVLFEGRGRCDKHDPAAYARFPAEVPEDQRYAINYIAWSTGKPLYPADQARTLDGMIE